MSLIDRTSDQIAQISTRLQEASNFASVLSLLNQGHALSVERQKSIEEVNRLTRGWVFSPS